MANHQVTRWKRPVPLPKHVAPYVRQLFVALNKRHQTIPEVAEVSGVGGGTISSWRYTCGPGAANLDAALHAVGYKLVAVPLNE